MLQTGHVPSSFRTLANPSNLLTETQRNAMSHFQTHMSKQQESRDMRRQIMQMKRQQNTAATMTSMASSPVQSPAPSPLRSVSTKSSHSSERSPFVASEVHSRSTGSYKSKRSRARYRSKKPYRSFGRPSSRDTLSLSDGEGAIRRPVPAPSPVESSGEDSLYEQEIQSRLHELGGSERAQNQYNRPAPTP